MRTGVTSRSRQQSGQACQLNASCCLVADTPMVTASACSICERESACTTLLPCFDQRRLRNLIMDL